MSATRSGLIPPPGRSAMIVASLAEDGILPITMPPNFTKSWGLRSRGLPTPTMIKRDTSRPAGATRLSADPFLPLNRSAAAARVIRSPVGSSALRAAAPNFSPSSQNRTRTPFAGVENGAKPSFRTPGMGADPLEGAGEPAMGRLKGLRAFTPLRRAMGGEQICTGLPCPAKPLNWGEADQALNRSPSSAQAACQGKHAFSGRRGPLLRQRPQEVAARACSVAAVQRTRINVLLCILKGFALAQPFCFAIS